MNLLGIEESEKFKVVKVKGYEFKIKVIRRKEDDAITRTRCTLQGNHPIEKLTQKDFLNMQNVATCDICIEEYPKGWDQYESCENWDDDEIIDLVAEEIRKFTDEFRAKLKKNKPVGGVEEK